MFNNESSNSFGSSIKTSVKWLDVPIQKFNTAVPHFVESLKVHHDHLKKLRRLEQWEDFQKEHASASRTVKQLTSLLGEMDNLRNQVCDADLSKFDKLTTISKKSAMNAIQSHQTSGFHVQPHVSIKDEDHNPSEELQEDKLQIVAELNGEIQKQERLAVSLERLHEDAEDIHSMFQDLSQLVHDQGEHIEKIEEHVETTHVNVVEGEGMLCQAAKYKTGLYPLAGALIGTVVGGPIGLLAGFKLGSLTAVGCGFLGFTGGRFLKQQNEVSINEADRHRNDLAN